MKIQSTENNKTYYLNSDENHENQKVKDFTFDRFISTQENQLKKDIEPLLNNEQFENLLKKLDIDNLSNEEKKLYKSIIEDGYISNSEVKDLSYEEVKTLSNFVFKKDETGSYIDETLLNSDLKAGVLLSTSSLSENVKFNKSIFTIVQNMDSNNEISQLMYELTGTYHSNKLTAYSELQTINYDEKDITKILENKLLEYKEMIEVSADDELSKEINTLIAKFSNLIDLFNKDEVNKEIYQAYSTQEELALKEHLKKVIL